MFAFESIWHRRPGPAGGLVAWSITALAVFFTVFHVYTAIFGSPTTFLYLGTHLLAALLLVFLWYPTARQWNEPLNAGALLDLVFLCSTVAVTIYLVTSVGDWELRSVTMTPFDYLLSLAFIVLILEAIRRTVGMILVLLILCFMGYALFANWFPDPFFGPPVPLQRLVATLLYGTTGVFGIPLGVMADYVFLYVLFGVMLEACGAGALFNNLGVAAFGHRQGGAAKAAVASSGLQGMISGSAISNVLVSGAFTIPMMKRLGYRPSFAAAVEASSSNGGIITPPIMGAAAFMMAEFTGIPYTQIIVAAAVPAFLYYFVIYWTIHFEARRLNLRTIDRKSLPAIGTLLRRDGHLLLPLAAVTWMLVAGFSVAWVAIAGIVTCFVLSFVRKDTRLTPMRVVFLMEQAVRSSVGLSATCAGVGIIIGVVDATGLNFQISQLTIGLAGDRLWVMLVITAVMALVLGMGLSASAVYITMVATVIPIITQAGVSPLAAHLFAIYFGIAANITPPVALAAFAAAPLAGANPFATGFQSARLGIGLFLLPFMFVYSQGLLLQGSALEILTHFSTAALGLWAIALASVGYLGTPIAWWGRGMLVAGSLFLIVPTQMSGFIGLALVAAPVGLALWRQRRAGPRTAAPSDSVSEGLFLDVGMTIGGSPAEVPARALWAGWTVTALVLAGVLLMGDASFHARQPSVWLGMTAAVSALLVLALRWVLPVPLSLTRSQ